MLVTLVALCAFAQAGPPSNSAPLTRPERTQWEHTSTNADVAAFLAGLRALPHADRLQVTTAGSTVQGRRLTVVSVRARDAQPQLRALIIANIHGGEVEGKEAAQILLREFALGEHAGLLEHVELRVWPVFNADGNDEIDRGNRVEQNGPDGGVGRRHNSQDRDLNRDFIKAESPEVRALLADMATFTPHLFMDLHTTNGSHHGYHLTYCTSLNANTDPELSALMHERFLPRVRQRMLEDHGYRIFDYGNFGRGGPESGWSTFSADPRLAINYVGLRHGLSLLSEAYSYLPFVERAQVTRGFVLAALAELVARRDEVVRLRAQAQARAAELPFRFGHELAPAVTGELLVGAVEERVIAGLGKRSVAKPEFRAVQAPLRTRFVATGQLALPAAWAIVGDFPLVAQIVRAHGIEVFTLKAPAQVTAQAFAIDELSRQRAAFQGYRLVKLGGKLGKVEHELSAGTLIVPAQHTLARLAAQLLEASSDDGLATWGYFDAALTRATETAAGQLSYPVLRLTSMPEPAQIKAVDAVEPAFPSLVPYVPLALAGAAPTAEVTFTITVVQEGERAAVRGFEAEPRFAGRQLGYQIGDEKLATLGSLPEALAKLQQASVATNRVVVQRAAGVTHRELVGACEALRAAGVAVVALAPPP
jgi:hypothetical protein